MSSLRISSSVGIGGKNNPNDIKAVQIALNKLIKLIPPTKQLKVDGMLGRTPANSNTVAAIKLFQRKVVGIISPDGCVDANGRTHRKINEQLSKLASNQINPAGMLAPSTFLRTVIRPTLESIGLTSKKADYLLLGTAIQESRLKYRTQLGGGPALSYFQIEPATHNDIWDNYLAYRSELADKVKALMTSEDKLKELKDNDAYACAIARIHYLRVPEALPAENNIEGQAKYWKTYYNTLLGKGTVQEYVHNWSNYGVKI